MHPAVVVLLLFVSLMVVEAGDSNHSSAVRTYIIHMDTTKVSALGRSTGGARKWHEAILDSLPQGGTNDEAPELLYVYNTVLSGFAAKLTGRQLASIKEYDGFLSAHPDQIVPIHTTHTPEFLRLKPGANLWSSKNLANDVIIGIVDTGIWPEHISFHDSGIGPIPVRWKGKCQSSPFNFSCNRKLIGARAYWAGHQAITSVKGDGCIVNNYNSVIDTVGHGTHTASIAAGARVPGVSMFGYANGSASGVHTTARIAAYKACWQMNCADSDITAAIDQAVADGVDVLSLSLGSTRSSNSPFHANVIAIATFGAIQKGVFVSCSAGNSGPRESSLANDAPWLMTVAASSIDRRFSTFVHLGDGRKFVGVTLYRGVSTEELPIAYNPDENGWDPSSRYCSSNTLQTWIVEGRLVVCDDDGGDPIKKGQEVKRAGGAGMLLLNGEDQGEEIFAEPHVLPAARLGATAAAEIRAYRRTTPYATASISFLETTYDSVAPVMTQFSSRGPSLAGPGVIKPDVTAPGLDILAAWPPDLSPSKLTGDKRRVYFNVLSGTSMSCPHVSGLAALVKSMRQNWSPAAIKSALMTTAYAINNIHSSIVDISTDLPATPFALGSGHVDAERAAHPGLVYDIEPDDYLLFMCTMNYTSSEVSMVSRKKYNCAKSLRVLKADWSLNYPSFSVLFRFGNDTETAVQWRTVTNVGPCNCTYEAIVREPDGVLMTVEPRILKFSKTRKMLRYRVTFVGLPARKKGMNYSFGELVWACGEITVRSPVAVAWGLQSQIDY